MEQNQLQKLQKLTADKKKEYFINQHRKTIFALICAGTMGGKTTLLKNILQAKDFGIMDNIKSQNVFIFSENVFDDDVQQEILEFLKKESYNEEYDDFLFNPDDNVFTNPVEYMKQMNLIIQYQRDRPKKERPHLLFIFDDYGNGTKDKMLSGFLSQQRHIKISTIILAHDFVDSTDTKMRNNLSHLFLFEQRDFDRTKQLIKKMAKGYGDFAVERYREATDDQMYGFITFNYNFHPKWMFFRNLNGQYEITDY